MLPEKGCDTQISHGNKNQQTQQDFSKRLGNRMILFLFSLFLCHFLFLRVFCLHIETAGHRGLILLKFIPVSQISFVKIIFVHAGDLIAGTHRLCLFSFCFLLVLRMDIVPGEHTFTIRFLLLPGIGFISLIFFNRIFGSFFNSFFSRFFNGFFRRFFCCLFISLIGGYFHRLFCCFFHCFFDNLFDCLFNQLITCFV